MVENLEQKGGEGKKFEDMTDDELRERVSEEYITNNSPTTGNPEKESFDAETSSAQAELERRGN